MADFKINRKGESRQEKTLVELYIEEVTQKYSPGASIKEKKDSLLLRMIGFCIKPFNPNFMEQYITTIGNTIYFPSKMLNEMSQDRLLDIVAHETIHIKDYEKSKVLYCLSYLFPQILVLLALLSLLAIFGSAMWLLSLFALLFLAPIPAYWRYKLELKAYRTTVIFARKVWGYKDGSMSIIHKWIISQLATKWYYFTWPFAKTIEKALKDESFMQEEPYQEIIKFLDKHNLTNGS